MISLLQWQTIESYTVRLLHSHKPQSAIWNTENERLLNKFGWGVSEYVCYACACVWLKTLKNTGAFWLHSIRLLLIASFRISLIPLRAEFLRFLFVVHFIFANIVFVANRLELDCMSVRIASLSLHRALISYIRSKCRVVCLIRKAIIYFILSRCIGIIGRCFIVQISFRLGAVCEYAWVQCMCSNVHSHVCVYALCMHTQANR